MTAEELVQHHLQKDLSQPQFWQDSLSIVEQSVERFEQLVEAGDRPKSSEYIK